MSELDDLNKCLAYTFGWEGGFSNDREDPGGKTQYGITEVVARKYNYNGPMQELPKNKAIEIYLEGYWRSLLLNQTPDHGFQLRMFDYGVNAGPSKAGKDLQQALNRLNKKATLWPDIVADGMMGMKTLAAIQKGLGTLRYRAHILFALDIKRGDHYQEDIERAPDALKPSWDDSEVFMFGWQNRLAPLMAESASLVKAHG